MKLKLSYLLRKLLRFDKEPSREKMNRFKETVEELEEFRRSCPPEWSQPIELDEETAKSLAKTQARMRQVPAEMAALSVQLAKRGWYTWMDMPFKFLYAIRAALRERRFR